MVAIVWSVVIHNTSCLTLEDPDSFGAKGGQSCLLFQVVQFGTQSTTQSIEPLVDLGEPAGRRLPAGKPSFWPTWALGFAGQPCST